MLPNISIPESGGFVVANAIDSNRGLFIEDSGRGVGGWAPNLRLFIMYELVFFGAPGVERFDFGVVRFVDDFDFCTPFRFVALFGVFGGDFTVVGVFFVMGVLAFFPLLVGVGLATTSASFAARTDARLDAGTLRFLLFVVVVDFDLVFFVIVSSSSFV
jgi:hypothetical protein